MQFVTQPYTSDIDHTGGLSEAIVTLPQAVAPQATVELEIAYEGVIVLDATRLTRIGTPEDAAKQHGLGPDRPEVSRRCAERDTWRGIRLRPRWRIFRKATACSRFWAMEGAGSRIENANYSQRDRETMAMPQQTLVAMEQGSCQVFR